MEFKFTIKTKKGKMIVDDNWIAWDSGSILLKQI